MTNRVGGAIVCYGGTTSQMNIYFDTFQSYDTPDPTSNFMVAPQPTGTQLYAMDFDVSGTLYAVDNGGKQIGTIDTTSGVFTPTFLLSGDLDLFATVTGIACDPTAGQFYLTTDTTLYRLDPTTGITELVADYDGENSGPVPDTVIEIAVDNNGNMFIFTIGDDRLYSVDKSTAVCTEVGVAPNGFNVDFIQGLDFDPDTNMLYGSLLSQNGDGLYGTWDTSTGVFTTIEPFMNLPPDTDFYEFKLAIRGTGKVPVSAESIIVDLGSLNSGACRKSPTAMI